MFDQLSGLLEQIKKLPIITTETQMLIQQISEVLNQNTDNRALIQQFSLLNTKLQTKTEVADVVYNHFKTTDITYIKQQLLQQLSGTGQNDSILISTVIKLLRLQSKDEIISAVLRLQSSELQSNSQLSQQQINQLNQQIATQKLQINVLNQENQRYKDSNFEAKNAELQSLVDQLNNQLLEAEFDSQIRDSREKESEVQSKSNDQMTEIKALQNQIQSLTLNFEQEKSKFALIIDKKTQVIQLLMSENDKLEAEFRMFRENNQHQSGLNESQQQFCKEVEGLKQQLVDSLQMNKTVLESSQQLQQLSQSYKQELQDQQRINLELQNLLQQQNAQERQQQQVDETGMSELIQQQQNLIEQQTARINQNFEVEEQNELLKRQVNSLTRQISNLAKRTESVTETLGYFHESGSECVEKLQQVIEQVNQNDQIQDSTKLEYGSENTCQNETCQEVQHLLKYFKDTLNQILSCYREEQAQTEGNVSHLKNELESVKEALSMDASQNEIQTLRNQVQQLQELNLSLQMQIQEGNQNLSQQHPEIQQLKLQISQLNEMNLQLQNQAREHSQKDTFSSLQTSQDSDNKLKLEIQQLQDANQSLQSQLGSLVTQESRLQSELSAKDEVIRILQSENDGLEAECRLLQQKFQIPIEQSKLQCESCQKIGEELADFQGSETEKVEQLLVQFNALRQQNLSQKSQFESEKREIVQLFEGCGFSIVQNSLYQTVLRAIQEFKRSVSREAQSPKSNLASSQSQGKLKEDGSADTEEARRKDAQILSLQQQNIQLNLSLETKLQELKQTDQLKFRLQMAEEQLQKNSYQNLAAVPEEDLKGLSLQVYFQAQKLLITQLQGQVAQLIKDNQQLRSEQLRELDEYEKEELEKYQMLQQEYQPRLTPDQSFIDFLRFQLNNLQYLDQLQRATIVLEQSAAGANNTKNQHLDVEKLQSLQELEIKFNPYAEERNFTDFFKFVTAFVELGLKNEKIVPVQTQVVASTLDIQCIKKLVASLKVLSGNMVDSNVDAKELCNQIYQICAKIQVQISMKFLGQSLIEIIEACCV